MTTRTPVANRAAAAPNRITGKTAKTKVPMQHILEWEDKDQRGRIFKGEVRAESVAGVNAILHKQDLSTTRSKRHRTACDEKIAPRDIAYFTCQLSTMLKTGVPLLQSIDVIAKGHANPNFVQLFTEIRVGIESSNNMMQAFRCHPKYFDMLYCSLIDASERSSILDTLLERPLLYMGKPLALEVQIKSALIHPISVLTVAFLVTVMLTTFVVPSLKGVFSDFSADLPVPVLFVIVVSDFLVKWWIPTALGPIADIALFSRVFKRSENVQHSTHRLIPKIPIFGDIIRKAAAARWTRTLATMFVTGMPLVKSVELVIEATGNWIYHDATFEVQQAVCIGTSLTNAVQATHVFDNMVLRMTQVGEESGTLDNMLLKVAEFCGREVGDAVTNISTLIEPVIIVFLGMLIGGMVMAMYLPISELGTVV